MNIGIKIVERKPIVEGSPRLICGNSGDTITFTFDSEWSNYVAKVARFVYVKNGVVVPEEVLFNGNVVEIPVLSNITEVYIGVYAGELRTTTPVTIPCDLSILCKGGEPVDPTPDIYAQILDALNAKLILEGNASSATKLETPRTIQVDLENSNGASFDGTEDVNPGVTGVLPKEHGGTGTPTPELIFAPHAVKRVNGSAVAVNDSSNSPLANLKLYGKTEQNGTPTPTEPIELKSVGDSGSYSVDLYGKNILENILTTQTKHGITYTVNSDKTVKISGTQTHTLNTYVTIGYVENVKSGMVFSGGSGTNSSTHYITLYDEIAQKVISSGAGTYIFTKDYEKVGVYVYVVQGATVNYTLKPMISLDGGEYEPCNKQSMTFTDTLRSVGEVKDEIDFARGVKIQRFGFEKISTYALNNSGILDNGNAYIYVIVPNKIETRSSNVRCTHAKHEYNSSSLADGTFYQNVGNFVLVGNSTDTYETLIAKYGEGYLLYELETPIETPLSETELNAYRQLMTNKGNTTILSEANLEVDYYTDTLSGEALGNLHSSLYSEIETLKQAIVSLGGEV